MSSFSRQLARRKEKENLVNLKKTYGKKPKGVCPVCKKHSLFFTNKKGEIFCVRCDSLVGLPQ